MMDLARNVEVLRDRIGGDWLDRELSDLRAMHAADRSGGRRELPRFHPFAELMQAVEPVLDDPETASQVSPALARLNRLSISVQRLTNAESEGLDDRLDRLRSGGDAFESTEFELNIAGEFARKGRRVDFIPERAERTPEFMLDGRVEVECKKKLEPTPRDLRNEDKWSLIERRVMSQHRGVGLSVDLLVDGDPTRGDVDWVLANVTNFVESGEGSRVARDDRRQLHLSRLDLTQTPGGVRMSGSSNAIQLTPTAGKAEITAQFDPATGSLRPDAGYSLLFRTTHDADWAAGVKSSLKKAAGQFSKERPAVIAVGIPAPARWSQDILDDLKATVKDFLSSNTSVSAVVLVMDDMVETADGPRPRVTYVTEFNDRARHPVADEDLPG